MTGTCRRVEGRRILAIILKANALLIATLVSGGLLKANHAGMGCRALGAAGRNAAVAFSPTWGASLRRLPGPLMLRRGIRSIGMKVVSGSGGGGGGGGGGEEASQQQREGAGGGVRGERGGGGARRRGVGSGGMVARRRIGSMDGSGQGRRASRLSGTDATRSASTESCNSTRGGARGGMGGRIGSLPAEGSQRTNARRRWEVKTKMEAEKRSDSDSEYLDLVAAAMLDDRELEGAASLARDLKRIISPKEDPAAGLGLKEAINRVDVLKVLPALESLADVRGGLRAGGEAAGRKLQKAPPVESGGELPASATNAAAGPSPPVLNGSTIMGSSIDSAAPGDKKDSNGVGSAARKQENLADIVDFLGLLSSSSPSPPRTGAPPIPGGSNQTVQGEKGRLGATWRSDAGRAIGGEQLETFIRIVDVLGVLYPNKTQPLDRPLFTAIQADPSGEAAGGGSNSPAKGRKNSARKDTSTSAEAGGGVQGGALGGELFMSTLSRFRLVPASMPTGRLRVPAGLSSITKLKGKGGLLEALRPASENAASLPPADAVIALNQLKRLRPSSLSSAPPAELIDQMDSFVLAVTAGMSRLSPKYIALALNAYIGWEGAERDAEGALLDCAASRVLQMRDDPVTEYTFPSQSIAMILNAFARAGRNEPELITCLCDAIAAPSDDLTTAYGGTVVATPLITPPPRGGSKSGATDWNGQNVAVVVNSLVKLGTYDKDVFSRLSLLARRLPNSSFTPQSVGNIVNAFVRAGHDDPPLFEAMHKAAMSLPPHDYNPQAVANIMNACKRTNNTGDSALFAFLSEVALGLPTSAYTPQSIANIASACSAVWSTASSADDGDSSAPQLSAERIKDDLVRHLCEATLGQTLQDFAQPQALALALNAFSSLGESYHPDPDSAPQHLTAAVKHMMAAAAILAPPREAGRAAQTHASCEAWEAAMICNAVARCYGDADLVCCLGAVLLETPAPLLAGIDVANVANAMARLSARDDALLAHLTAAASLCGESAAKGWDVQASANTLNALSRLGVRDETCFQRLAERAAQPGAGLNGRLAGSALNAFARSELLGGESFEALCKAATSADGWDEQAICNAIHALAMVGSESSRSSQLVDVLCNELQAKAEGGYMPQGIANAAWGLAVLQVRDESVDAWVEKAISAHAGDMDAASCRQISQYIVERRLRCGAEQSGKWDAMQRRLRGRIQKGGTVTSNFQKDVCDALRTFLRLDCIEEWEEPRSRYTVDIWLPRLEIGIEVDGPYHYARGTREPLGSTLLKRRQLRDLGMRVVTVPYWEWEETCGREEARADYLRAKIEETRQHP